MRIKLNLLFNGPCRHHTRALRWLALLVWLIALCPTAPVFAARHAPHQPADTVVTNCSNATQLSQAVAAAGTITFSCGAGLHTIPISAAMSVAGDVIIDGGGQIALDGGGHGAPWRCWRRRPPYLNLPDLRGDEARAASFLERRFMAGCAFRSRLAQVICCTPRDSRAGFSRIGDRAVCFL